MTFSVALLITGVALLVLGLVGKITVHEIHAGTESKILRAFISLLGLLCVGGGIAFESSLRQAPQQLSALTTSVDNLGDQSLQTSTANPTEAAVERHPTPSQIESDTRAVRVVEAIPNPVETSSAYSDQYTLTAVIDDPDGYTNLRSQPTTDGQIIQRIGQNERFKTFVQQAPWWHIRTSDGKYGYVHSSRIKTVPN